MRYDMICGVDLGVRKRTGKWGRVALMASGMLSKISIELCIIAYGNETYI